MPLDKARIRGLSEALLVSHRTGRLLVIDEALALQTAEDAYRVQETVLRALDPRRPRSWKVSPAREGVESFGSPTPLAQLRDAPAQIAGGHRVLGVEAEIAFRFRETPPPRGKRAALEAAVGEAFVLLELCETRLANWDEAPALCRLADFQSHGGFATGSGTRDWRGIDFSRVDVALSVNGKPAVERTGSHPSGDFFALVAWAVAHCAARGMPLAAGDIVTTGTWSGLTPIVPGDQVLARFAGIGEAALQLPE